MRTVLRVALLLVIMLVSLSAYLRLSHSGIGCADWPACYGRIGAPPVATQLLSSENAYQRIVAEAQQPLAWATPLHRLVASLLGLLVLLLVVLAVRQKQHRLISLLLLGITVFLALLGLKSGSLHSPAVIMGNLCGGFLMLALLAWVLFQADSQVSEKNKGRALRSLPVLSIVLALTLLSAQIILGGLTSANFAARSCQSLPSCHGNWLPSANIWQAMDLSQQHVVTPEGWVVGGRERIDIHIAHRLGAVLTALLVLLVGFLAWRSGGRLRVAGVTVLLLVTLEFTLGVTAILSDLPIGLAVAHNWLAGLLLLGLLKILALNRVAPAVTI